MTRYTYFDTYGPATDAVNAVVAAAANLTDDECAALVEERRTVDSAVHYSAVQAVDDAAWAANRKDAVELAWSHAWKAAERRFPAYWKDAFTDPDSIAVVVMDSVSVAAQAAVVSDLVGEGTLTQEHIDTLMGPWTRVVNARKEQ